ncbi:MAG TPA: hypothetical protein VLH08_22670 [Acidobacteriota bacterium]|nr:hypothetical protein [Acidobacteriota bacterium]
MRFKLHMIFLTLFFLLTIVPLWAQEGSECNRTAVSATTPELRHFDWLVKLVTTPGTLYMVFDPGAAQARRSGLIEDVERTAIPEDRPKVRKFLNQTELHHGYKSLAHISYYMCKRPPCPPIKPEDYDVIIRLFRDQKFRDEFFKSGQTGLQIGPLLNKEFPGKYTKSEISCWEAFARYSANAQLFADVATVLCDPNVWGPCP